MCAWFNNTGICWCIDFVSVCVSVRVCVSKSVKWNVTFIRRWNTLWATDLHWFPQQLLPFSAQLVHKYWCSVLRRSTLVGFIWACVCIYRWFFYFFSLSIYIFFSHFALAHIHILYFSLYANTHTQKQNTTHPSSRRVRRHSENAIQICNI